MATVGQLKRRWRALIEVGATGFSKLAIRVVARNDA